MNVIRNRFYRVLVIAVILGSFTPVALISKSVEGAVAGSKMIVPDGKKSADRDMDEGKVRRTLENKIVAERLKSYGLSKEEVIEKMDRMSDDQVHQLAALSDRIPAGGDAGAAAVVVLVIFIIVILTLIVLRRI